LPRYNDIVTKPAIERDTRRFYAALVERSEQDSDMPVLVFEGSPTELFKELKINPRYYTPIRKILLATESITILQTGNRSSPSVWVLNHEPPSHETWPQGLTGDAVSATLKGEFERRITALETWRENLTGGGKLNIFEALRDFEARTSRLEKELASLKTATSKKGGTK
jgi:hypothetical protein